MNPYLNQIDRIQFEISTVCNSQCIGCARTDSATLKTKPSIPKNQFLSLDIIEKIFQDIATNKLTELELETPLLQELEIKEIKIEEFEEIFIQNFKEILIEENVMETFETALI